MTAPFTHLSADEFEDRADLPSSPDTTPTFGEVLQRRFGRRELLRGALASTALAALPLSLLLPASRTAAAQDAARSVDAESRFPFEELARGVDETHHVAKGYQAKVLLRWGDPLLPGAPEFDPYAQTAEKQLGQFGYNNDFVGYLPLPLGSRSSDHGLLWVNHEYTNTEVMFPGLIPAGMDRIPQDRAAQLITREIAEVEMAAHGGSIVELKRGADGDWTYVKGSPYNRRLSPLATEMAFTGPAAGHERMRTSADPTGTRVIGMMNNCAGGVTPWGTFLTCEENFDGYFIGTIDQSHPEQRNYDRYTVPGSRYLWGLHHPRFDVNKEPNEANRFGWVVEVDPYDPTSTPRKHTALGRAKHEGAGVVVNKDGRVVVYMGDDQVFEHIYRFVSRNRFDPNDRAKNMTLLEDGTLYAARYNADGTLTWLPLVQGQGPLTPENGFRTQADVSINTRHAATLVGATRMDRPEDIEVNHRTQKVYAMLTNNSDRRPVSPEHPSITHVDAANPRVGNLWGHIVEMSAPEDDHTAETFRWTILLQAGNPADPKVKATFNPATTENGWFACPDNCVVDGQGRLWVATDQGNSWPTSSGSADGLWAVETEGPLRGTAKAFFRCPIGAEMCGPFFTPDDTALFLAVQHPGVDGVSQVVATGERATFEHPGTRWPDFDEKVPPRPSVVVITKDGGGPIGS
ncbi:PhoX family protein [Rhodospirillum centenum]|uniref:dTDP-glucose 4,6-dehydratase n=1 Tax=Rhodospirillum centenum (strain ATCC 51521 / SW) TaxID=414684 RepID=B6IQG0_RHOCS|nr:PhoX family phosphatase [Rhodospirillum centenum]ACI97696.1 conserved hypothetical protein [Rhodospirillum centenum SW]